MPDIVIAGATFRGVPQIDIPKEGSGTASFVYEDGTKQITQNGTGIDVSGYASVDVAVPSSQPVIQPLSVTQNGTYTAPSGVDGYSPVSVTVPGIVPTGSQTVNENGTYDVTALAQMIVAVSGGGGASNVVTGTFNGTDAQKNSAVDININYSGSGYPLVIAVFPSEGPRNSHTGSYYSLVQRLSVQTFIAIKNESDTTPDYSSNNSKNYWTCLRTYKSSSSSADSYQTGSTYGTAWRGDGATSVATQNMRMKTSKKMSVYFVKDGTDNGFAVGIEYRYYIIYSS